MLHTKWKMALLYALHKHRVQAWGWVQALANSTTSPRSPAGGVQWCRGSTDRQEGHVKLAPYTLSHPTHLQHRLPPGQPDAAVQAGPLLKERRAAGGSWEQGVIVTGPP